MWEATKGQLLSSVNFHHSTGSNREFMLPVDCPPLVVLGWGTDYPQEYIFPTHIPSEWFTLMPVGQNMYTSKGAQFRPISKEWRFFGMMSAESSSKIAKPLEAVISWKISAVHNCNLILENYQVWVDISNANASWRRFESSPQGLDQKPPTQELGDHKAIHLVWGYRGKGSQGNFQSGVPCLEVPRPTQSF